MQLAGNDRSVPSLPFHLFVWIHFLMAAGEGHKRWEWGDGQGERSDGNSGETSLVKETKQQRGGERLSERDF